MKYIATQYANRKLFGGSPNKISSRLTDLSLHKTFVNDFNSRLARDINEEPILKDGKFPTHLYYGGVRMNQSVDDCLRFTNNRKHQEVMKDELNKLIITVSSTSIWFITNVLQILSIDINRLYTGQNDTVNGGLQDVITSPDWLYGNVFNVFIDSTSDKRKFKGFAIGGWFTDDATLTNNGTPLRDRHYECLQTDLYQAKPDMLDPNINPYFQVVTDNTLFSFISDKERIHDNRRMRDLTIDDFHSLKQYMLCFNEGGVVTRENICRPNYRSNVNTFLIDIAMPYMDNGQVKVKHITYGYLEDYHKFKHMGYEPVFNTFAEEYIVG